MADQPSRKRRIVTRVILSTTFSVLLLAWYVASYLCFQWCSSRGAIGSSWKGIATMVFVPVELYRQADLPGADWLRRQARYWYAQGLVARDED